MLKISNYFTTKYLVVAHTLLPVMAQSLHDHLGLCIAAEGCTLGAEVLLHEHGISVGRAGALLALVLAGLTGRARLLGGALLGHAHLAHLLGGAHHLAGSRLGLGTSLLPHFGHHAGHLGKGGAGHGSLHLHPVGLAEVGVRVHALHHTGLARHAGLAGLAGCRAAAAHGFLAVGALGVSTLVGFLRMRAAARSGALGGFGTSYTRTRCHFSINEKK